MNIFYRVYSAVILSTCLHCTSFAHDLEPLQATSKWNPDRASYLPGSHTVTRPPGLTLPEFVVALPHRWPFGKELRICFVGGSSELRSKILGIASEWFTYANLKMAAANPADMNCQTGSRDEIRIGFSEPGFWSYIGNESLNVELVSKNLTSMNFEGFDVSPLDEPRFSGTVLHEFGHALGFEHEHQSPSSGCDDEYDWNKLYSYYKSVYNWDKPKVDANVRQLLNDRSAYGWSQFDPSSIMIYGSNPNFLKKGTASICYLHDNNTLSALDKQGAQTTYPPDPQNKLLGARTDMLKKYIPKISSGPLKKALNEQFELSKEQLAK